MIGVISFLTLASSIALGQELVYSETSNPASPLRLDFVVSKTVGNFSAKEFWASNKPIGEKRDAFAETVHNYKDLSYQINLYLGSDKQQNQVVIDTGSSDLWVPGNNYNPLTSNSSRNTGYPFSVTYLSGITASGDFYLDDISFDTASAGLSNFQFARASAEGPGILGLADKNQEKSPCIYDNLPWALKEAGVITKASYSLFLGASGSSGSVIFGGIDTEKFVGELAKYPIDESTGRLALKVETVAIDGKEFTVNAPALVDSGTSLGLLNSELMSELDDIFNSTIVEENGLGYRFVSCDQPRDKAIEFNFGSNTISIPYPDAVLPQENGACMLGFAYFNDFMVLGDVFLRKSYAYFDLSEKSISLAQASYSDASNIISA